MKSVFIDIDLIKAVLLEQPQKIEFQFN